MRVVHVPVPRSVRRPFDPSESGEMPGEVRTPGLGAWLDGVDASCSQPYLEIGKLHVECSGLVRSQRVFGRKR